MDLEKIIAETVGHIVTSIAQRSASVTADKVKELIDRLADRDPDVKRALDLPNL